MITFLNEPELIFFIHSFKYRYVTLIIYSIKSYSFIYTQSNCIQIFLSVTNNSIKHQTFVYRQLNDQTVLFLTFRLKSFACIHFKYQTVLFDPKIGSYQVLPLRARVDLEAIAMKGYSAFSKAHALQEPHHRIV